MWFYILGQFISTEYETKTFMEIGSNQKSFVWIFGVFMNTSY